MDRKTEEFWINQLIEKRESLGLNKVTLSMHLGKCEGYINRVENIKCKIYKRIEKIQDALSKLDESSEELQRIKEEAERMQKLIQELVELRTSKNLSSGELSKMLGQKYYYIYRLESTKEFVVDREAKIKKVIEFLNNKDAKEINLSEEVFKILSGSEPSPIVLRNYLDKMKGRINDLLPDREICSTLLHKAVFEEHYNSTKLLLSFGADPTVQNLLQQTPEDMALIWCTKRFAIKFRQLLRGGENQSKRVAA